MESTEGFSYRIAVKVNIAICYSCNQFVYVDKRVGYELYHNYKIEEYWCTNYTRNRYCDICFKEYMELKQKLEVETKKIRAVKIIQQKWIEIIYKPDGLKAKELAKHYKLLWVVKEEMHQ
ncbi:328_t:CDS:2, partial [Scutellospora calospora]